MIGRVLKLSKSVRQLLYYLYGPGKEGEHVNPHLVGGWMPRKPWNPHCVPTAAAISAGYQTWLQIPLALLGDRAPDLPVWHVILWAAPGDPELADAAWMAITAEVMHRTGGLSEHEHEDEGVPWVAVRHGPDHVHIAAVLARYDRRRARLSYDYYRVGEAIAWAEREYGLQAVARRRSRT